MWTGSGYERAGSLRWKLCFCFLSSQHVFHHGLTVCVMGLHPFFLQLIFLSLVFFNESIQHTMASTAEQNDRNFLLVKAAEWTTVLSVIWAVGHGC
ncbi:hypothetical protein BS50DRAFT_51737 [Corynespora cassiicola Philippines]|uniref:Uncharacterized protein n=1 Tax=Corynespora cassiicola Philippines TaxID=1448308 RepID=A0A2T2NI65_CORCC|nr:hypothetical protein BS50DRAFT_51737 [Corynespora cassiicola Philippines]